jgi:hypothetical protein
LQALPTLEVFASALHIITNLAILDGTDPGFESFIERE